MNIDPMKNTITWLHISDTHLCKDKTGWDANDIFEKLFIDLQRMENDYNLCPDLIFFTGDLAYGQIGTLKGLSLKGQFEEAEQFIENVRNSFFKPIEINNIFIVPGNHEVNLDLIGDDQTEFFKNLSKQHPNDANDVINNLIQNGGIQWQRYMERLADYRNFLQKAGYEHLLQDTDRLIYSIVREINEFTIGIAGLNSVWSFSGGEKGELWLGRYQIGHVCNNLKNVAFSIALVHHPVNWYTKYEDPKLNREIERKFQFFLHGHEHQGWVSKNEDSVRIAAAACYDRSDRENGYNFVRIYPHEKKGEVYLREYNNGTWIPKIIGNRTDNDGIMQLKDLNSVLS